jgi:hypothetical protein
MGRVVARVGACVVLAWVIAHLLYLGPIREATETTVAWVVGLVAASAVVAAVAVLVFGLATGRPAWLRFVSAARTVGTVLGCALIVVGLLHYRNTEPRGEIHWVVVGLVVLVGAGIVHWWVIRTQRRIL